jgi:hypothetical protein
MTAGPSVDRATASRLVAGLEHAWTAIRGPIPTSPSRDRGRLGQRPRSQRLSLGHFAAGRWQLTSPDTLADRAEVLASGVKITIARVQVEG